MGSQPERRQSVEGAALVAEIASRHFEVHVTGLDDTAPGYLLAALFDPSVLGQPSREVHLSINLASSRRAEPVTGMSIAGTFPAQKERVVFSSARGQLRVLHLPVRYARLCPQTTWQVLATCAELPGVIASPGAAAFAFDPVQVLTRHLDMAEPDITADLVDLIVRAIVAARGGTDTMDANDLRRDFHALGISCMLVEELLSQFGRDGLAVSFYEAARSAGDAYRKPDEDAARRQLTACFQTLAEARRQVFPQPIHLVDMPHGGILFEGEGYAEYDWPEAAAKVLRMYLDWTERFGYRFAPDISAGTLWNLALTHPQTIAALGKAWSEGRIEFVNGTCSQPYLQIWDAWSQTKQFEEGLRLFHDLFGQQPSVYAAQEIALHPGLPKVLRQFGYRYVIHRSQNYGTTPRDDAALIDWEGQDGTRIPALPGNSPRSEKLGSAIYRNLPRLLKATADAKLPFAAITNLIDQTFVGAYKEEVVRSGRYGDLWGAFVTPTQFFEKVAQVRSARRKYSINDYEYDHEMPPQNYHRYESGGFSSVLEHWLQVARELEGQEKAGRLDRERLTRLLDGQSHDGYVVSFFKRGAFLDIYMTDYAGPRYRVTGDHPRGVDCTLRDGLGVPARVAARLPVTMGNAQVGENTISLGGREFALDRETGHVCRINGRPVRLGLLRYRDIPMQCQRIETAGNRLVVHGYLIGHSRFTLSYGMAGKSLFCLIEGDFKAWTPNCRTPYWDDCVSVAHGLPENPELLRYGPGYAERTTRPEFFSVGQVGVRSLGLSFVLHHGGNIFYKRSGSDLLNRLWAYNEVATSFWWGVTFTGDV